MPQIQLKKTRLHYQVDGSGEEVLVFGHSLLFNLRMFDQQVQHFQSRYRCVRFDFRGHGESEITENGYDLDTLTEDIAELITKLDCKDCHFIGFSMGGMVGMRLTLKHPSLIKSLVLIDTSSEPEPRNKIFKYKVMLFIAGTLGLKPLAGQVMSIFFGAHFLRDSSRKDLRLEMRNHFLSNRPEGIVKAARGVLFREGIAEEIDQIKHKTTIIVGEKDEATEPSRSEYIHSKLTNSTFSTVPRAGHMSPVEEPDIVNKLLDEHLSSI